MIAETRRPPSAALAVAVTAGLLALSCGGGGSPATPTPSTPIATPTPAPTPTPGGGVGQSSCRLGNGDVNADCDKASSKLVDFVLTAMDELVREKPQLFDLKDEAVPAGVGNYKVVDREGYLNGMVVKLQGYGMCAQRDPGDGSYQQIQVKNENGFSETFDVMTGSGYVWHNGNTYRRTCTPAEFPVSGEDIPPAGSGCGKPYPPAIDHFNSKVHIPGGEYDLLDSTPIVHDARYCAEIGYTDFRTDCPVRVENSFERTACEAWRVGNAKDTGRPGPTWTRDGKPCTGLESGCENFAENQYGLKAYAGGTYRMCGQNGACGELVVQR